MLQCLFQTHQKDDNTITAICTSKQCKAQKRIMCRYCIKDYHKECNIEYLDQDDIINKLNEIKSKFEVEQYSKEIERKQKELNKLIQSTYESFKLEVQSQEIDKFIKQRHWSEQDWIASSTLVTQTNLQLINSIQNFNNLNKLLDEVILRLSQQEVSNKSDIKSNKNGQFKEPNSKHPSKIYDVGLYENGLKVGLWQEKLIVGDKAIGSGIYQYGLKFKEWVESHTDTILYIERGQYSNTGLRQGQWDIFDAINLKKFGGGMYEQGRKVGKWVEPNQSQFQYFDIGEYEPNGMRDGNWTINGTQGIIGGGTYLMGQKVGIWKEPNHACWKYIEQGAYGANYMRCNNWDIISIDNLKQKYDEFILELAVDRTMIKDRSKVNGRKCFRTEKFVSENTLMENQCDLYYDKYFIVINFQFMEDPRFARIKKDPRFKSMPKGELKTKIGKRFKKVLTDEKFSTQPKFDRYGNKNVHKNEFKDHYEAESLEDEEASVIEQSNQEELSSASDVEMSSMDDEWEQEEQEVLKAPQIYQATKRLALQNYEWQEIKAKDLMVLFSSFLPQGSAIKSVSVYQSDFGKQRMEEESREGPKAIFKADWKERKQDKDSVKQVNDLIVKGDETGLDIDPQKLREYERDRLKYYYAVIECDSAEAADHIYQQTNGNEFELSNLKIDLRFIPDEVTLPKDNLTASCNSLPSKLQTKPIVSRAVGHTSVKLTWEESKPRTSYWGKSQDLDKIDWGELVGDGDEDEESQDQDMPVVEEQPQEEDWRDQFQKKNKSKLKITFNSGFNPTGKNDILDRMQQSKKHFGPRQGVTDDFFAGFQNDHHSEPEDTGEKKNFRQRKLERKLKLKEERNQKAQLSLLVDRKKNTNFVPNNNDSRFAAVHERPEYAIDPTHKNMNKKTKL